MIDQSFVAVSIPAGKKKSGDQATSIRIERFSQT